MQLCLTKLSVILEIDPYVISLDFFSMEKLLQRLQIFKARNYSLIQIEEIVRIYADSKYLDRNVRWVLFILAEYISTMFIKQRLSVYLKPFNPQVMRFHGFVCLEFYAILIVFQLFNGVSSQIHVSWTIFNQYLTSPLS